MTAPAAAAMLAGLEARHRVHGGVTGWWDAPEGVDLAALTRAVEFVESCSFGDLAAIAVEDAQRLAGPWSARAPQATALAVRDAPQRVVLAEAIIERFGALLDSSMDVDRQQWWWCNGRGFGIEDARPVDGSHQTSRAWLTATARGLWTVTDPPVEAHDGLVDAWELIFGPVSRWSMTVHRDARIVEIGSPADWADLVVAFPLAHRQRPNSSWEIPGPNHQPHPELLAIAGQRAQRSRMRWFVEPDWAAVASTCDAVHLSWGGFLTTEGTIIDLGSGDLTMMRNWCSERTLWLQSALEPGQPLPPAELSGRINGVHGVDPADDPERVELDRAWLDRVLTHG